MRLKNYYQLEKDHIQVSRQQASDFAKFIANDFNPLHDVDAKRFCVPGDLLFGVVLDRYGLNQHMRFVFSGMVGGETPLYLPPSDARHLTVTDEKGKEYLSIERDGEHTKNKELINNLVRVYVAFSGQAFPHVLVPLMEEKGVMINPARPLIIYESMELNLDRLDLAQPQLELNEALLNVNGKRGDAQLNFVFKDQGQTVGTGTKKMLLSGLRQFEADTMAEVVKNYHQRQRLFSR